ncbi:acyl-CoA dehydrogenase family protein [Planotetraspora sp. A-T 1434]|uniref:acyl-CoA dehydrogenase family protein n=1 Tax=Planotetraspora sp. A-T 1434 TaxID=2979219 RepID=UPI0021C1362D|nr:acyl-CoA dehydrogenase family protein [Planotetraspora sp. A-T 1434]MCT9929294.1 acyl-CoA dehydrogenase family protein [Planotetraspora sp. A-T 1434]
MPLPPGLELSAAGDDNRPVRQLVRDFTAKHVMPVAADLDASPRFPAEIYREMAKAGLFGITVPEELGGAGARALDYLHVMEGLSFGYASVADQCGLVELVGTLLTKHGTPDQQREFLGPLLRADRFCAYALTEAGAGSDLRGVSTRARPDGDGWILDGEKVFIHNAPVADFATVLARTGDSYSVFLVDLDANGVSRTYREHKMGQRASQVGGLAFESVRLPAGALLGGLGEGFTLMTSVLARGRLGISGLSLGISRAAITAATEQAETRTAFGRPIGANQGVAFPIADAAAEYRAAFLLAEDAARRLDQGQEDAAAACSMAKLYASEACVRHADMAVQVFGGSGYIQGYLPERLYRDARITRIYEGTSEIQRLIISRWLMDTRGGTR